MLVCVLPVSVFMNPLTAEVVIDIGPAGSGIVE